MRAVRVISLLLLIMSTLYSAHGELQLNAETEAIYDSNFSNSDRHADAKDDPA